MDAFIKEMQNYRTPNGAVHSVKHPAEDLTSNNHHVIAAVFVNKLFELGRPSMSDRALLWQYIDSTQAAKGIFNRKPLEIQPPDRQAHDDVLAIAVISRLLAFDYAQDIWEVLSKWQWKKVWFFKIPVTQYYDNEFKDEFNIKKWFGRFLWTTAIFKACNGKPLNIVDKLAYSGYLLANTFNKNEGDTSGRRLRYNSLRVMATQDSFLINASIKYWNRFISKLYPNGLLGIFERYDGAAHPFATHGKTEYKLP